MKSSEAYPVIDPSTFIHQITFLDQSTQEDASGSVPVYLQASPPDVTYGRIKTIRGREVIQGGQDTAQSFIEITTYYRAGRGSNTRIQAPSGSVFIVQTVENVEERNMFTIFNCIGVGSNE